MKGSCLVKLRNYMTRAGSMLRAIGMNRRNWPKCTSCPSAKPWGNDARWPLFCAIFLKMFWGINVYVEVGMTYKRNQFSLQGQPSTEAIHGPMDGWPPHHLSLQGEAVGSCRDGRWVNSSSVFQFFVCRNHKGLDPDKVINMFKHNKGSKSFLGIFFPFLLFFFHFP